MLVSQEGGLNIKANTLMNILREGRSRQMRIEETKKEKRQRVRHKERKRRSGKLYQRRRRRRWRWRRRRWKRRRKWKIRKKKKTRNNAKTEKVDVISKVSSGIISSLRFSRRQAKFLCKEFLSRIRCKLALVRSMAASEKIQLSLLSESLTGEAFSSRRRVGNELL